MGTTDRLTLNYVQLCLTLCDPMDYSPSRLLCPWNFPGKNTGVSCHFFLQRYNLNGVIKASLYVVIDAFELWCWRRLLRVPWTARRSNQSILNEISPEYSLEGLVLKLKL